MTVNILKKIAFLCFVALVFFACAKIGMPTGGPRDVTPPKVVESKPAMNSVNFDGKRITITFDEFVQLTDISKNFVISPPLKKKPAVVLRNKSIVIDLEDTLKHNTTYRLYFGNAVADNNEKNILKNFEFVFSTGSVIDSLSLRGRVIDAFDHKPDKETYFVMLYNKFQDSIPRKHLPDYITKTDEHGFFSLTHMRKDTFMILALKDLNMNFKFDLPNEPIAFSDTLIPINQHYFMPDSLIKPDSLGIDSTQRGPFKSQIKLYSFIEDHEKQYLKKEERVGREKINLIFNLPVDTLQITPLNFKRRNWFVPDYKLKNDTLSYWITDTSLVYKDTLKLRLGFTVLDSLERPVPRYDTIALVYKKPLGKNKGKTRQTGIAKFTVPWNVGAGILDLNNKLTFMPSHPLETIDTSKIQLFKVDEKKKLRVKYKIMHDSTYLRRYYVNFKMEPETDYELVSDTLAFKDIYGFNNDSTGSKFKTQKEDYYGVIKLTVQNVKEQMIIQLFTEGGKLAAQKIIDKSQLVVFDFLEPGKYKLKAIYDRNRNKVWDTGNFAKKIQPEKVLFNIKVLPVRSNWDVDETWTLE